MWLCCRCVCIRLFSPEISEIDIIKVHADSVADLAGLKVGDKVIELDSCTIPACSAEVTKKSMTKSSGETLLLLIKNSMAAKSK
ncbi:PDZ domain-containing protein [Pseudoalteromonas agarivorans]|uniref:PDZ domain-containing protein n=1 Tax=Pseudoalteromonas agarivorans TaxID=176102 RepID=UPI003B8A8195